MEPKKNTIILGTRGSKLALAQAGIVQTKLELANPGLACEIKVVQTGGDLDLQSPLYQIGGKGVFIKELEYALQKREIDLAVHSLKDVTTALPADLALCCFLKAEAAGDVLVLNHGYTNWEQLPPGSALATGSMRRRALVQKLRSDIQFIDIRGNVLTRIQKLREGAADGLLLSEAGLIRLELEQEISYRFNPRLFCPAPGQGVIALEARKNDLESLRISQTINDPVQSLKSTTELACLEKIGFDCRVPLGLHVELCDVPETLTLAAFISNVQMTQYLEQKFTFPAAERFKAAAAIGNSLLDWKKRYDP